MKLTSLLIASLIVACLPAHASETPEQLAQQVRAAETAFAATMAQRNLAAFESFLAEEAVFFGTDTVLRGRRAVVEGWKGFYQADKAPPFSWAPSTVEVLADGTLAHSSGPVMDPQGRQIGTFNSVWRRGADGQWKVVFDKGCDVCQCATKKTGT